MNEVYESYESDLQYIEMRYYIIKDISPRVFKRMKKELEIKYKKEHRKWKH